MLTSSSSIFDIEETSAPVGFSRPPSVTRAPSNPPTPKDRHRHRLTRPHEMTVLVMCGLPARGKSFISKKLERFLQWRGEQVRIFNVGERRRKHSSAEVSKDGFHDAAFFAAENMGLREQIAQGVLMEMVAWLRCGDESGSGGTAATRLAALSSSRMEISGMKRGYANIQQ